MTNTVGEMLMPDPYGNKRDFRRTRLPPLARRLLESAMDCGNWSRSVLTNYRRGKNPIDIRRTLRPPHLRPCGQDPRPVCLLHVPIERASRHVSVNCAQVHSLQETLTREAITFGKRERLSLYTIHMAPNSFAQRNSIAQKRRSAFVSAQ